MHIVLTQYNGIKMGLNLSYFYRPYIFASRRANASHLNVKELNSPIAGFLKQGNHFFLMRLSKWLREK